LLSHVYSQNGDSNIAPDVKHGVIRALTLFLDSMASTESSNDVSFRRAHLWGTRRGSL